MDDIKNQDTSESLDIVSQGSSPSMRGVDPEEIEYAYDFSESIGDVLSEEPTGVEEDIANKEFVDSVIRIIQHELPIIAKYNMHLYQIMTSAFSLILDQSQKINLEKIEISEETKRDVDEIINQVLSEE